MRKLEFLSNLSGICRRGCICLGRMVFCEVIRQVLRTWAPVNFKLALFHPILDPIKEHVHGFCTFLFKCTIDVPCGSGIVSFHWCGGLFVPSFLQCSSEDSSFLCIYKNCSNFCDKLLPLPQPPVRARTDARTNTSAQRATQLRRVLARVYAVTIQNQITTTVP
jgi:hypothetical protein